VLLVQDSEGRFENRAEALGVFDGHWAWNAKFADLDHDQWQDLYLVNGWFRAGTAGIRPGFGPQTTCIRLPGPGP
jgi:hypothetical protein